MFVAYFASAQINCYRVRDWPIPRRILDPYVEFRALTWSVGRRPSLRHSRLLRRAR
jgi:hypothetical protein